MVTFRRKWGDQAAWHAKMIASKAIRKAETINELLLDALSDDVAVIDVTGRIVAVNHAWKRSAKRNSKANLAHGGVGQNYLDVCRRATEAGAELGAEALQGIEGVINGTTAQFRLEYPRDSGLDRRWFLLMATPLLTDVRGAVISHRDITDVRMAQDVLNLDAGLQSGHLSQPFLPTLTKNLAMALQVRHAFVGELVDQENGIIRLLSYWAGTGYGDNLEYVIAGTPCERVLRGHLCYFPSNVQQRFPEDLWLKQIGAEAYMAIPLFDQDGKPVGHMGILHDEALSDDAPRESILRMFAARAASEVERRRSASNLKYQGQLIDSVHDAIISTDERWRLVSWNHAAEEIYGWQEAEVLGRPAHEVLNTELVGVDAAEVTRRLEQTGEFWGQVVEHRKNGEPINIEATVTALRDDSAKLTGYVAINRDITERKRAEDALRQAEAKRSALLAAIPDMMFTLTADGTFLSYTPAEGTEPFLPPHEFLGRHVGEVMPPPVAAQSMRAIEATLQSHRVQSFEYRLDVGGETRDFEARLVPSSPGEVLAIVREYTAQRRQERTEASRREIEELEGKVERQMVRKNPYGLTFREFTVLNLVAAGVGDKEIAERLSLSIFTVNKHVANILGKMDALSRTEAAVRAQREGLLP
jgi:PAS domain S-box-containing protein